MRWLIATMVLASIATTAMAQQYYDPYAAEISHGVNNIARQQDAQGRSPFSN